MKEIEPTVDELSYELSMMLEAMLYYAGVKKDRLEDAAETTRWKTRVPRAWTKCSKSSNT